MKSLKQSPPLLLASGALLITGFMLFPLMALMGKVISEYPTHPFSWFGKDTIELLLCSILFSLGVSVSALLIAVPAASILTNIGGWQGKAFRLLVVSPVVVPLYIHALAWQRFLQSLGLPTQGDFVAFAIETLARVPLLIAATLIGYAYMHPTAEDAMKVYSDPVRGFLHITLPQLKAALIAGCCIVFLFSLNEYGLASLFMRSTYSLDIFIRYSATGDSAGALLFAFPLILTSAILTMIAVTSLSKFSSLSISRRHNMVHFSGPIWLDVLRAIALLFVLLQVVIPLKEILSLSILSRAPVMTTIAIESFKYSISISLIASVLSIPLAWVLAEYLHRQSCRIMWLSLLICFTLPSSLTGIGSIVFWSWTGMESVYNGWFLLVSGYMTKLLPLSTLFIYGSIRNSDSLLWDAARIYISGFQLWFKIRLYQIWPGMVGALLINFALTLPELELSLLLSPAGKNGIGIRLFNYLHYGAPEQVAYFSLMILLSTLLFGGGLYSLTTHYAKGLSDSSTTRKTS